MTHEHPLNHPAQPADPTSLGDQHSSLVYAALTKTTELLREPGHWAYADADGKERWGHLFVAHEEAKLYLERLEELTAEFERLDAAQLRELLNSMHNSSRKRLRLLVHDAGHRLQQDPYRACEDPACNRRYLPDW